jgi:signal transduction histidine kinase
VDNTIAEQFRLSRRRQGRMLAGVAGGIADRLGIGAVYVRAALATLTVIWGLGVVVYLVYWIITLERAEERDPEVISPSRRLGLGMGFIGAMLLLRGLGLWMDDGLTVVVATVSFGLAALLDRTEAPTLARFILPGGTAGPSKLRSLVGVVLLVGGLSLLLASVDAVAQLGIAMLAVLVTGLGLTLAFGPWVWRMGQALANERRERIRQEERAEMAAHLHDSVLQTLALIQRSEDPRRMMTLARAQERELRSWLYDTSPIAGVDLLSTALRAVADRVEADHHIVVEVITVGDLVLDGPAAALVAAAGEAMANAARHSAAHVVSVYLEVEEDHLDLWVTDQGKGFDPEQVPSDRRGISQSIKGRMERNGGRATIRTRVGEGTEVHLWLPGEST